MSVTSMQLFEILSAKLGSDQVKVLVEYVENKVQEEFSNRKDTLANKDDINRLELKISETKVDIVKWIVAMVIGLFIALIGAIAALFVAIVV